MKKILSLVLVAMMIFSIVPATFAADTAEDSNYQEALDFLGNVGFYQGGAGVTAKDDITRWQMALFVDRLVTGQVDNSYWATTDNNSGFTDVDQYTGDESYILGAITYAAQQGIINGYGDGTFGPNDGITYRDAIVMTVRALGINYPASGYPWSYIADARELGLMNGITGIGWEDELAREVVVKILYNAFFADVDGAVVAEDVFGIGTATVMVTGSKNVAYDTTSSKVVANGYVQISEIDAQGEPTGTKYHVPGTMLGLADVTAENAAVGSVYSIYYKDNFYSIVMYECLSATYENRGNDKADFSYSATNNTITVDGVPTYIVRSYTNLFNQNVPNNASVMNESKVFLYNAGFYTMDDFKTVGKYFYMQADGKIFSLAPATITWTTGTGTAAVTHTVTITSAMQYVGYYSNIPGYGATLFAYDTNNTLNNTADDKYVVTGDLYDAINNDLGITTYLGDDLLDQVLSVGDLAYADVVASDANQDGVYDRVAVKQYAFGQYSTYKTTRNNDSFAITTSASALTFGATTNYGLIANYRFTGETPKSGDYVLYYVDDYNKECDILAVIPQKSASTTDTYWSTGYVLGFFQTSNLVYIDDGADRGAIAIGYDTLANAPLYSFAAVAGTAAQQAAIVTANNNLINHLLGLQEKYVTYVVIDDQVVYMTNKSYADDYVIIDEFVNVDSNGITAKVWSTIAGGADQINITEFNGWNIKGFDWTAYWQSGLFQGILNGQFNPSAFLSQYIPVKAGEIYQVVYNNGSDYNLTTATPVLSNVSKFFVQNGYIHGVKDNAVSTAVRDLPAVSANDFWLIREEIDNNGDGVIDEYKIYARTGKIADTDFKGVDVYKAKSNDYVLSGTTAELATFLNGIQYTDSDIQFVTPQVYPNWTDTDIIITDGGYFYGRAMTNFLTGNVVQIKYDPENVAAIKAGLEYDKIYMAVGGVIYDTTPLTVGDVAEYLMKSNTYAGCIVSDWYSAYAVNNGKNNPTACGHIMQQVMDCLDKQFYPNTPDASITAYDYIPRANVTVIGFNVSTSGNATYDKAVGQRYFKGTYAAWPGGGNFQSYPNYTTYTFYNNDMTAVMLLDWTAGEEIATDSTSTLVVAETLASGATATVATQKLIYKSSYDSVSLAVTFTQAANFTVDSTATVTVGDEEVDVDIAYNADTKVLTIDGLAATADDLYTKAIVITLKGVSEKVTGDVVITVTLQKKVAA